MACAEQNEPSSNNLLADVCLMLSWNTPANKLKQLKFLLQDVTSEIDIHDNKTFLELISHLDAQAILHRDKPSAEDALLLCELFDAVSLHKLSDDICSKFSVERDPSRRSVITPFRRFLVKLSCDLTQGAPIDKMMEYLDAEGQNILHRIVPAQDICPLDIIQAMVQACLISPSDLTVLKKMMRYISRNDLANSIDDFNRNNNICKEVPYGLRRLPRDMVQRHSEVNDILDLLKSDSNRVGVVGMRSGDVIGIRGMGGIGKTVLAQAVSWSVSVSRQVIWLDIGHDPDCLALVNKLVKALGGNVSFSDITGAQAWIKENTVNKDCLVVLDDVWSVEHASVFDYLSGECQLLITTRDAGVVRGLKGSAVYELKIMQKKKSRTLLYQSAQVTPTEQSRFTSKMQQIIAELLEECRGLPLSLSLVGSNLTDTRVEQDWQDILDDLKTADLEELRSLYPCDAYPHDNLLAAINVSFQRLENNEQEKFLDFAIFPEDTDIPSDILELCWSCSARAGRRILAVLERKSLIQKGPVQQGKNSYRVHDLLLDFARGKRRDTIMDVRCMFLETLRGQCVEGNWATFTGNRDYYFKYLPYHLHSSEQNEELLNLYFDFQWLEQKVKETNLPSLMSDFRFFDTTTHEVKLLKSSLMLSADVIERTPDSIGPQLLGRLLSCANEYPHVTTLLEHVRETCTKSCQLMPLYSCLTEPIGPLIKIFTKHKNTVYSLFTSICSAGTSVISASADCSIKIHELETGKEIQVLEGHTMAVYCLALSHGGTMLASGSFDDTTRLWNMDSFEQQFVLKGQGGRVNALDFSADDQCLFTGSNDGNVRVWHVETGNLLNTIRAHADDNHIRGLCTTRDGLYTLTASLDHTIKIWHADTFNVKATLFGHTDTVYSVVATSDSQALVSASGDKTLKIWSLRTYQEIRTLRVRYGALFSAAVSQDSKHVLSGGDDKIMRLWCFHTGDLLFCFKGHSQSIRFVTFIPDGSQALSGSQDKSFRVWDLDTSAYLKNDESRGHSQDVLDITVTQDGTQCVTSCIDGTLKVWKCATAEECFTLEGHTRRAISVAISPDDRHVASLALDSLIKVWDLIDGKKITFMEGDKESRLVRFNSSSQLLIIGCVNDRVYIWDWQNKGVPNCVTLPTFTTTAIACDDSVVYTCSRNDEVCQIDLSTLHVSIIIQGPNPKCTSMVILPKGEAILSGIITENLFIYWELSSWREIRYNAAHSDDSIVTAIDITTDGKLALSGSSAGTISLVNLESTEVVQTFPNTRAGVGIRFVSVLRNDARFIFVDESNTVELRNLNNNEGGLLLVKPTVKVVCVASLGLTYILLGCANGELLLLDCVDEVHQHKHQAHQEAVCQVAGYPKSNTFLYFASGSKNGCVKLWFVTVETVPPLWKEMWSRDNVYPHPITALAFDPSSGDIVCGSYDNKVYRVNGSEIVRTYQYKGYGIAALRVLNDTLVAACIHEFCVVKWNLNNAEVLKRAHGGAGREQVSRLHVASDHVVSKGSHHSLLLWNLKTGLAKYRLRGHSHDIRALAFVPGGEFLLSGARDKTLKLWDLRNGCLVEEFHFESYVLAISCSQDGVICVGLQGGQICFLRVNNLLCE